MSSFRRDIGPSQSGGRRKAWSEAGPRSPAEQPGAIQSFFVGGSWRPAWRDYDEAHPAADASWTEGTRGGVIPAETIPVILEGSVPAEEETGIGPDKLAKLHEAAELARRVEGLLREAGSATEAEYMAYLEVKENGPGTLSGTGEAREEAPGSEHPVNRETETVHDEEGRPVAWAVIPGDELGARTVRSSLRRIHRTLYPHADPPPPVGGTENEHPVNRGELYDRLSMEIKPDLNHWLAALAAMCEKGGDLGGSAYMEEYAAESVYAFVSRVSDFVDDLEPVLRGGDS